MAQWREEGGGKGGGGGLTFLATDHLGTPACALAGDASVTWSGGFEPFGRDWQHGTPEGALASGLFLRLPGQWDHPYWHRDLRTEGFGADLFYNVHRWYEAGTGRYVSPDPASTFVPQLLSGIGSAAPSAVRVALIPRADRAYSYGDANPVDNLDLLGLGPQRPGCDGVPDCFENQKRQQCCLCHDICFYLSDCAAIGSWSQTILFVALPQFFPFAPDCVRCNLWVSGCFSLSLLPGGWTPPCPWPAPTEPIYPLGRAHS